MASGAWWLGALTVPITGGSDTALLELERRGTKLPGYRGDEDVDFSVPVVEVDDVFVLLLRLVAQARRDGVLPGLAAAANAPAEPHEAASPDA